ncbi:ABC-type transport auxiliary lipoprotein family protein [Caenispirillum salinarum]|uniref:ABC-type transport auxiliary lipoprotein family protein n=1 Tax=Caenispirillum salinarum TaxID=859058 RepID=UPI0038501393
MTRAAAARLFQGPALALTALLLAACSSVIPGQGERPESYRVTAPDVTTAATAPDARLLVEEPSAAPGLDTDRIAVWRDPRHLQYYADSRWVEDAPEMVRAVMLEGFRSSRALGAVGRRSVELDPTHRLRTRLTDFESGYEAGTDVPTVRVEIAADLLAEPGGNVAGQTTATARATPADESVSAVIAAFDAATQRAVSDLVTWTVETIARGRTGA